MTLADWRYIAIIIGLIVVVLIDDGNNLLLRQVVDIALAAHIERRGFCGRYAVDGEVLLFVGKSSILSTGNNTTLLHLTITCASHATANVRAGDCGDSCSLVVLSTVVVRFILICIIFTYRQCCDTFFLFGRQTGIGLATNGLTYSVWCATNLEGCLHDIVCAGALQRDR